MEPEETAVARQQFDKHVSAVMDMHATVEELLETMFSMQSMLRLYSESHWANLIAVSCGHEELQDRCHQQQSEPVLASHG
jgi:hypothetical protein